ncbi:MAG: LarC family nickel insertion protein [Deltaproteobacteria bacterium]|nr:MAG: LarC family nickel insertion protein [Deltaproteobacteria bacterium]
MRKIESKRHVLVIDPFSGVSGDMLCGALADLSGDVNLPASVVESLGVSGVTAALERRVTCGIAGFGLRVTAPTEEGHRNLGEVVSLIENSRLPEPVRGDSLRAFTLLAEVEGMIHGVPADRVSFHEAGAVDSIVDVALFFSYLHQLSPEALYCGPLPWTEGEAVTEHGPLPLPAPATVELARRAGASWRPLPLSGELVTPTGVLLLAVAGARFSAPPEFVVERAGVGVGEKSFGERPNLLRAFLCRPGTPVERDRVLVVETNVDDMDPAGVGYLFDVLSEAGVLDFSVTPATMKKNRPGWRFTLIVREEVLSPVLSALFSHSTTIGVRVVPAERVKLVRREERVNTPFGEVRVKVISGPGGEERPSPEFDDLKKISREKGISMAEACRVVEEWWRKRG